MRKDQPRGHRAIPDESGTHCQTCGEPIVKTTSAAWGKPYGEWRHRPR